MKKVFIGGDHASPAMKAALIPFIEDLGFAVENMGTDTTESVDYPIIAEKVARAVQSTPNSLGILICGTGIGMSLCANKYKGIRAAAVSEVFSAKMARKHNNANILCMGARVIGMETAKMITEAFLTNDFEGGRHERRVNMIEQLGDVQ